MAIYTVHIPEAAPDILAEANGAVFVREGFSGRAFLFGLFYLLWYRLWRATAVWILILAGLMAIAAVLHPPAFFVVALLGLMHLYLGAEGPDLLRGGLTRRGHPLRDVVSAPDLDTAETLFFARRSGPATVARSLQPARNWVPPATTPAVIGMFPDGSGA